MMSHVTNNIVKYYVPNTLIQREHEESLGYSKPVYTTASLQGSVRNCFCVK